MTTHSVRDHYPEASSWMSHASTVVDDFIITVMDIQMHDGARFIDVWLTNTKTGIIEIKRLLDLV